MILINSKDVTKATEHDDSEGVNMLKSKGFKQCDLFKVALEIFNDESSYIGFCKKTSDGFKNLGTIKVESFTPASKEWCQLRDHVAFDCYWTINNLFAPACWEVPATGLRGFRRKKDSFKTLNAVWVDLDIGRPDDDNPAKRTDCKTAIENLLQFSEDKVIPPPHVITLSGRGIYVIWLIDNGWVDPVNADFKTKRAVENINRKLIELLSSLAPDRAAIPVTQVLRFPGVVHSKTGKVTRYFLKNFPRYGLDEMQKILNVSSPTSKTQLQKAYILKSPIDLKRLAGAHALNRRYADDILKIEKNIGGFKQGERGPAIMIYAQCLQNSGVKKDTAIQLCKEMGLRCDPPCETVNDDTIERIVRWVFSTGCVPFRADTLCKRFNVTCEIAENLALQSIVPFELKQRKSPAAQKKKRDAFIQDCIKEEPAITNNQIARRCVESGFSVTRQHVGKLIKKLTPDLARRAGRPSGPTSIDSGSIGLN